MAYAWNSFNTRMTVGLLPGNATKIETAFEAIVADRFARIPVEAVALSRSDQRVPAAWLPYLAAERSVDEFSSAWPLDQQRAVVADSFAFHQKKGTRAALDRALGQMSFGVRTVEWFEVSPAREAYTFRLLIRIPPGRTWLDADRRQAIRLANGAKNAHTLLQQIDLATEGQTPIRCGVGLLSRALRRSAVPPIEIVQPPAPEPPIVIPPPDPIEVSVAIRFGMGLASRITHRMGTA